MSCYSAVASFAVGEPGSYYLTHVSPEDGKGRTIAQNLFDSINGTELEDKLAIVDTDGTHDWEIQWMHSTFSGIST